MDKRPDVILRVALDTPLRRTFDYLPPARPFGTLPQPGVRVRVAFGRRRVVGVLVELAESSVVPADKLKAAMEILDARPVFDPVTFALLRWAADYYHHPLGEVLAAALPASLREGQAASVESLGWSLTPAGRAELERAAGPRAPSRRALLALIEQRGGAPLENLKGPLKPAQLKALAARGWATSRLLAAVPSVVETRPSELELTAPQAQVIDSIRASLGRFSAHLLYGVTGSGKTEVYLQIIAAALAADRQVLVLVPEISLTPQLVDRFQRRFSAGVVALHSGLTGTQRRDAWRAAHAGEARIVIGTRSAVFTPLERLSLVVVDEEHDASYKQQEGFRYSARDLAVLRAQRAQVPVVLGSATPSLETLDNVAQGRYQRHELPQRPGAARPPAMHLVDLRKHPGDQGLSQPALAAMRRHLQDGGQVIVFLNRRGYAPTLFCNACGWIAGCAHCDARMTLHARAAQLRCHHCGAHAPIPAACASCRQPLHAVGQGTERVEESLMRLFPAAPLARLDRDATASRGAMQAVLDRVHRGEARILVGTQMLTKGHHFPDVSLVVILDADQGLFASDFRATERLAQTITQVAGRAGRAARAGEVIVQTSFPEHPLLIRLVAQGYERFAAVALEERRAANWPPYSRLALLRAEARNRDELDAYLREAAACAQMPGDRSVRVLGPAAALMARRADHYRAHLLIESASRGPLQRFLASWLGRLESLSGPKGLRWSIDVDPLEVD